MFAGDDRYADDVDRSGGDIDDRRACPSAVAPGRGEAAASMPVGCSVAGVDARAARYSSTIGAAPALALTPSAAFLALDFDEKLSPELAVVWPFEATSFQR
jgi:hypothetical protein